MTQDEHPHQSGSYFASDYFRAHVADRLARGWTIHEEPGIVVWTPPPKPPGWLPRYGWWSHGWDLATEAPYVYPGNRSIAHDPP